MSFVNSVKSFLTSKAGKRGVAISDLAPIAIILVVAAVATGFGAKVLSDIDAGFTAGSTESQIVGNFTDGLLNLSNNVGTLGTILIAAVIIGVVATAFVVQGNGSGRL